MLNYDVPPDPEDYVHRIGRTARAESKGTAITFVNVKDRQRFGFIEKLIEREVPKKELPEGYTPEPAYDAKIPRSSNPRGGSGGSGGFKGRKNFKGNKR